MLCLDCLEAIPSSSRFCGYCGGRQMGDAEAHLREVSAQHSREYLGLADDEQPLAAAGWIPLLIHMHGSVEETIAAGHDPYEVCQAAGKILQQTLYDYVCQPQSGSDHD